MSQMIHIPEVTSESLSLSRDVNLDGNLYISYPNIAKLRWIHDNRWGFLKSFKRKNTIATNLITTSDSKEFVSEMKDGDHA